MDLLVYSSAVGVEEPELQQARERGIRTLTRGELLAALAADRRLIGVKTQPDHGRLHFGHRTEGPRR